MIETDESHIVKTVLRDVSHRILDPTDLGVFLTSERPDIMMPTAVTDLPSALVGRPSISYVTICPDRRREAARDPARRPALAEGGLIAETVVALVGMRAMHVNGAMRPDPAATAWDLASMIATDWPSTAEAQAANAPPGSWWDLVRRIEHPWIVYLTAVETDGPLGLDVRTRFEAAVREGLQELRDRLDGGRLCKLPDRVEEVISGPCAFAQRGWIGGHEAAVWAWASPIRTGDPMPRTT